MFLYFENYKNTSGVFMLNIFNDLSKGGSYLLKLTILVFTVMLTTFGVSAQMLPASPSGAEARETQLLTRVSPQSRAWIKQEAARKVATGDFSGTTAIRAAKNYLRGKNLVGGVSHDAETLAFLVMMESAKSAQEDLKAIMDDIKKINYAKSNARKNVSKSRPTSTPSKLTSSESSMAIAKTPAMKSATSQSRVKQKQPLQPQARNHAMPRSTVQPRPMQKAEFDRQLNLNKNDFDSLSEMGEMKSLELQAAMDRRSKIMSTLSNIMKKYRISSPGIIQNVK